MNPANQALQSSERIQAIWNDRRNHEDRLSRLPAVERRLTAEHSEPVDLFHLITAAVQHTVVDWKGKLLLQLPQGVFVQGPANDVCELIIDLIEHACTSGCDRVKFRAQVNYTVDCSRVSCTSEIISSMPDVSDYLRHELWDVVGKRGGQVSITSGTEGCRIEFTLPLERRSGTILG